MNKKLFEGLLKSVKQATAIEAGSLKPAREFRVKSKVNADALHATLTESDMHAVISDTWQKLGPAPEIDYDNL